MSGNDQNELRSPEIRTRKRVRQKSSNLVERCVRICERDPHSFDNSRENIDHRSDLGYDHFQMQSFNKSDQRLTVRGNARNLSNIHEENVERLSLENDITEMVSPPSQHELMVQSVNANYEQNHNSRRKYMTPIDLGTPSCICKYCGAYYWSAEKTIYDCSKKYDAACETQCTNAAVDNYEQSSRAMDCS